MHLAAAAAYESADWNNVALLKLVLKHCSIATINAQDAKVPKHALTSCKLQWRCWVNSTANRKGLCMHHMMSAL